MSLASKITTPKVWRQRPEVLLCPNIPKPLSGVAPRVVLGQVWWDATRFTAYASTENHCVACGIPKRNAMDSRHLEGHELYDLDLRAGRMTYLETVPLCHWCHAFIHDGRLLALLRKGEIDRVKVEAIMQHGKETLLSSLSPNEARRLRRMWPGIAKPNIHRVSKSMPPWADWRMVVDGKEYPPMYKSEAEWARAFGNA